MIDGDLMRHRWIAWRAVWFATILLLPRPSHAQSAPRDSLEIFGGYSYLRNPGNSVLAETAHDDVYALGWFAGAAHRIWRRVDLIGELGGQYKSGVTLNEDATFSLHSFLGGARSSIAWGPTIPFAQALAGVTYGRATAFDETVSVTKLTLQGGGGVDFPFSQHFGTRIQVDYRLLPAGGSGNEATRQFRIAAGIVYR
jgi:hypothetical protein